MRVWESCWWSNIRIDGNMIILDALDDMIMVANKYKYNKLNI
jgi:hypothetical protein